MISIIMAAYNASGTIKGSIASVMRQTYKNWELIVVNDHSSDDTAEIVRSYQNTSNKIRLINNPQNMGVSLSRKIGLENSRGDWIAILDSDDIWKDDKLEKQVALIKRKKVRLVYTGVTYIDQDGRPIDWVFNVPEKVQYSKLLKQNVVSNSSVLVQKKLYSKYYSIGDDMHEDFAMWLRIAKSGVTAYGINEPLLIYRTSHNSKSGNKIRSTKMCYRTYRYVGLNVAQSIYYLIWYMMTGMIKHSRIRFAFRRKYR